MSYVEVFVINKDGLVSSYGEAKNNHCFAPMVWQRLADQHRLNIGGEHLFLSDKVLKPLWKMAGTGKLPLEDDLLLQSTFDYVMIPKMLVEPLAERMRSFYNTELRERNIVPTMIDLANIIEESIKEVPDALGVCFNCCSANEPYWTVRSTSTRIDNSHPRDILKEKGKAWWIDTEYFRSLVEKEGT